MMFDLDFYSKNRFQNSNWLRQNLGQFTYNRKLEVSLISQISMHIKTVHFTPDSFPIIVFRLYIIHSSHTNRWIKYLLDLTLLDSLESVEQDGNIRLNDISVILDW